MSNKEYVVETAEEKRREMKARGIDDDAIPSVGKRRFRRVAPERVARRHEQKIEITMFVDADILDYFKSRAEQFDAAPYQTQINDELRRVMEADHQAATNATDLTAEILNNESFLRALKQKLAAV